MGRTVLALGAIALALALASGSWAGKRYIITSTHQVKPGVLTGANLKNHSVGLRQLDKTVQKDLRSGGPQGPAGPKGDTGAQGPKGDTGATGAGRSARRDRGRRRRARSIRNNRVRRGQQRLLVGTHGHAARTTGCERGLRGRRRRARHRAASSFTGVTFTGSGPLTDKVWITDGSEAFSPGMHALSDGFDFTYGSDNGDGSFHMMSGSHAGQDLTVSQIQADYAGYEAYGWVGVTGDGTTSVSGHISSVGGEPVTADATVDSTTAAVH